MVCSSSCKSLGFEGTKTEQLQVLQCRCGSLIRRHHSTADSTVSYHRGSNMDERAVAVHSRPPPNIFSGRNESERAILCLFAPFETILRLVDLNKWCPTRCGTE